MRTLKDYVSLFKTSAYLFKNGYDNKWQYFIPLIDYDDIIIDDNFDQDTPTVIVSNKRIVASIQKLMGKNFLSGDDTIFIVPIQYDKRPKLDIFKKTNSEDELFDPEPELEEESTIVDNNEDASSNEPVATEDK